MENEFDISRRQFLKESVAAGAGVALTGGLAPAQVLGANDKIRVGVLGSGGRAQYIVYTRPPGKSRSKSDLLCPGQRSANVSRPRSSDCE